MIEIPIPLMNYFESISPSIALTHIFNIFKDSKDSQEALASKAKVYQRLHITNGSCILMH
jgi:hypothetical protein